jgi:hypothetical protein
MKKEVKCHNCGNTFITSSGKARYCFDCRDIMITKHDKEHRERRKIDGSNTKQ